MKALGLIILAGALVMPKKPVISPMWDHTLDVLFGVAAGMAFASKESRHD